MPIPLHGQVGPTSAADNTYPPIRLGRSAEVVVTDLHGRFYEQANRGMLYSGGMTATAINNATFTTATLGATATPIVGLWNPLSNTVNAVILQVNLQVFLTALTATGPGVFMWCTSSGNQVITTGNQPFNRRTFLAGGSNIKDMSGVALTGLTNNLVVRSAAGVSGGQLHNLSVVGTAAGLQTTVTPALDDVDGAWIVPPGCVLALLCTTTPVAHSAGSGIIWEEVPV